MSGMAGKNYASSNKDRLKSVPLGSGNVYMMPYIDGATMPTDAQFETNENMIGRTKGGATFNTSSSYYTAISDDGIAKKRRQTEETASFTWGVMTWTPETVAKLLRTATATTITESGETVSVLEGGGLANQQPKRFWLHFVGGDDVDGKITLTGMGENIDALSAAFSNDAETIINPNFEFDPYDEQGHLYKLKMANQPNTTGDTTLPTLTALTIGSLTLTPTFNAGTTVYTATTENASDAITAASATGNAIAITVNGNSLTNEDDAEWNDGTNTVVVRVTSAEATNTYTITVTAE